MTEISVIIPCHNGEKYIAEAIDSVIFQETAFPFDIIVVNDGSDDRTHEILGLYKRENIKIINSIKRGVSAARNIGIQNSTGEFIVFLDADDKLLQGSLQILKETVDKAKTKVGMGRVVTKLPRKHHRKALTVIPGIEAACLSLYQNNPVINCSIGGKIYKKEIFSEFLFKENSRYEDLDLITRILCEQDKISLTETPVYLYRENPESFTKCWNNSRLDSIRVTTELREYALLNGNKDLIKATEDRRLSAAFNAYLLMDRFHVDEPSIKSLCETLIKEKRVSSLFNKDVRLKNKVGILVSYLGFSSLRKINRLLGIVG